MINKEKTNIKIVIYSVLISLFVFNLLSIKDTKLKKYSLTENDKLAYSFLIEIKKDVLYAESFRVKGGAFNFDKTAGWFLITYISSEGRRFQKYFAYYENNHIFVERTFDDNEKYFVDNEFNITEVNKLLN